MNDNAAIYDVPLSELLKEFQLDSLYLPDDFADRRIRSASINRPGLPLAGFMDSIDNERIQVIGHVEMTYLETLSQTEGYLRFEALLKTGIPTVLFAHDVTVPEYFIELAKKYNIPILATKEPTIIIIAALVSYLNVVLAPRITRHGVLVEVYGEGVLLLGESGVGKSETAIELVKRGHRLIADDAVELSRVSSRSIIGSAPEVIRHFVELRGIGVVDVRRIFGMGAVKNSEKVELIINLEHWDEKKPYDRLGLESVYTSIMDVQIPLLTVPVRPGRNLAIIIEVAAMNNRHKKMGYNAAEELVKRVNKQFEGDK